MKGEGIWVRGLVREKLGSLERGKSVVGIEKLYFLLKKKAWKKMTSLRKSL